MVSTAPTKAIARDWTWASIWLHRLRPSYRLYRYVTRTSVSFFDPSPNLVVRSKNGTFVRVT